MRSALLRHEARGLTMIELLVGMVIAMLSTVIIMQVYEGFEGQKRTTTGGADAQTNGSIALNNIVRDVSAAGYGLPLFLKTNSDCTEANRALCPPLPVLPLPCPNGAHCSPLMCDPIPTVDHDINGATPEVGIFPVLLQDGGAGAGASDTILVTYGDTAMGGMATISGSVVGAAAFMGPDPVLRPAEANNLACSVGDIAVLINGSTCELRRVTGLTGTTGITFDTAPTLVNTALFPADPGIGIGCLGNWNEFSYSIVNNMLSRSGAAGVDGIVSIQAQYGISVTPASNAINQWVDATGAWALTKAGNNVTSPALADRLRIKAIRVAVVARSGLWEKDSVSTACSSTTGPNPTGVCAWEGIPASANMIASPAPAIDLSNDPDWQHYRYRVFETIIPLRNVIWSYDAL